MLLSLRPAPTNKKMATGRTCNNRIQSGAFVAEIRASFWRRHRWLTWVGAGLLLLLVTLAIVVSVLLRRAEPFVRARIIQALQDRFHARVELDSFHMSLAHGLRAEGQGLRIWPPATVEGVNVPLSQQPGDPLISLDEFRFHAPLHYDPRTPIHISVVELKGLNIHLPPKTRFHHESEAAAPGLPPPPPLISFGVDKIECTSAHFVLETSKPGKQPLDFDIAHFKLTDNSGGSIRSGSVMRFEAELTNPRPVGLVNTNGTIGPWQVSDPGESPIQGEYTFDHADLSTFKGIAGILSSTGKYQGTLRDLIVDGDTDTPDFRLTHFGNSLPLKTHFHAKVDATNGDTWLEPVNATLGHSHFTAQGQIVRVFAPDPAGGKPISKGHDIALNINVSSARIEDFLHLASRTQTNLLTGAITMKATLHIPPGPAPVHERLTLNGTFNLDQAHFTSTKIQDGITQLSLRGQGKPKEVKNADPDATRSDMQGNFQMGGGVITLPTLTYTVPGATIELKGTYGVEGGALAFDGAAKLDATVSQMVGGVVGILLKPADRYFKKDGAGTEVPIHISGTRDDPAFSVDIGRLKLGTKNLPKSGASKPPAENQ
jgi:AsmA-like C-terminal region